MSFAGFVWVNGQSMAKKQEDIIIVISMKTLSKRVIRKSQRMRVLDKLLKMS